MRQAIFYFTGTGNSYYIARKLSIQLKAELIPVASVMRNKNKHLEFELAGIVYPVYYANTPNIVREFCRKMTFNKEVRLFAVCNYGGGRGEAVKTVNEILKGKGLSLFSSFGLQMPQNAFLKRYENKNRIISKIDKMINRITERIQMGKKGHYTQNIPMDLFVQSLLFLIKPIFRKHLIQMAGLQKDASLEEAVYLLDRSFISNQRCTGCGVCVAVCPVDNIKMNAGKPEWQHHCENCLACINFCPVNAIDNEITDKGFRYLNPDYSLQKAMMQKKFNAVVQEKRY